MNPKKLSRASLRLLLGLVLFASTFATAVTPVRAAPDAPDRNWKWYERNALKRILDRHWFEIKIAELCLNQATHAELLSMCQRLLDTLPQEIPMLQSWLQSWYGLNYTPRLTLDQLAVLNHLSLPRLHGEKFEIQSMRQYRVQFKRDVAEYTTCSRHAPHAEMAAFCAPALVTANQDFHNVLQWLCDWYDRCYGGTRPSLMDILEVQE
jgi:hypothetical protein